MKYAESQRAILRIWSGCWFPDRGQATSMEWRPSKSLSPSLTAETGSWCKAGKQSERSTQDWWQQAENSSLEINSRPSSSEIWHLLQLDFLMAA